MLVITQICRHLVLALKPGLLNALGRKMGVINYLDTILAPLSLFLMVGYHAYLWHCFKNKPSQITEGIEALKRKTWFVQLKEVITDPNYQIPTAFHNIC
jgi:hypothetical protein